jgi:hypothetical protein
MALLPSHTKFAEERKREQRLPGEYSYRSSENQDSNLGQLGEVGDSEMTCLTNIHNS